VTGHRVVAKNADIASLGLLVSCSPIATLLPAGGPVRLVAILALALGAPGAAILCHVDLPDRILRWGLVLPLSMAVFASCSGVLLWSHYWHPRLLLLLAPASGLSCLTRLIRNGTPQIFQSDGRIHSKQRSFALDLYHRIARANFGSPVRAAVPCLILVIWSFGLGKTNMSRLGVYGLIPILSPWFFVAAILLIVGFILELAAKVTRPLPLVVYIVAMIILFHATVPVLSHEPEYSWVYKHVGVAGSFQTYGRVTSPQDIYQQWPTFFTALAALSSLSGVALMDFAQWGALFFNLAASLILLGIFRCLTRDNRIAFLAVILYEAFVSWIAQDYLSPQAFAYTLALGVIAVAVRWLRSPDKASHNRLGRIRRWLAAGREMVPDSTRGERIFALIIIVIIYFTIVSSHQLTPYVLIFAFAAAVTFGAIRPWYVVVLLVVIAVGYLIPHYSLISSQYGGIFSGFNVVQNAQGAAPGAQGSAQALAARVTHALALVMWGWAVLIVIANLRRPGKLLLPALLAFSPFVVLFAQRYGGEAIYRVFLFSAPWCCLLIARNALRFQARRSATSLILICIVALVSFGGLEGLYGPVLLDNMTPGDVEAALYIYKHAPAGSTIVLANFNFPSTLSPNYWMYSSYLLPDDPLVARFTLSAADLPADRAFVASLPGTARFLVVSRSMINYAIYYSYPYGLNSLESALSRSDQWHLFYSNTDAVVYQLKSPASRSSSSGQRPRRMPQEVRAGSR
jgi:hypothetical protein